MVNPGMEMHLKPHPTRYSQTPMCQRAALAVYLAPRLGFLVSSGAI